MVWLGDNPERPSESQRPSEARPSDETEVQLGTVSEAEDPLEESDFEQDRDPVFWAVRGPRQPTLFGVDDQRLQDHREAEEVNRLLRRGAR